MRNLLELNERDNLFTAFAKGGAKGMIVSAGITVVTFGIGIIIRNKEENSKKEDLNVIKKVNEN